MYFKHQRYFLCLVYFILASFTLLHRTEAQELSADRYEALQSIEEAIPPKACTKATASQIARVNLGNSKYDTFLKTCYSQTNNSSWCRQLTRPNPNSQSTFFCTYGSSQTHRLVNPDTSTWKNAIKAVQLVKKLESYGISVAQIYNWWRPEPYNKNVGGAAGRHPYGTSIDVRFSTMNDMNRAHKLLCKWRSQGGLRALGYYGSTGLHLGIGDRLANTWGKSCSIY